MSTKACLPRASDGKEFYMKIASKTPPIVKKQSSCKHGFRQRLQQEKHRASVSKSESMNNRIRNNTSTNRNSNNSNINRNSNSSNSKAAAFSTRFKPVASAIVEHKGSKSNNYPGNAAHSSKKTKISPSKKKAFCTLFPMMTNSPEPKGTKTLKIHVSPTLVEAPKEPPSAAFNAKKKQSFPLPQTQKPSMKPSTTATTGTETETAAVVSFQRAISSVLPSTMPPKPFEASAIVVEPTTLVSPTTQEDECEYTTDESLTSSLCLVPLLAPLKEGPNANAHTTCYWPSLVFQSLSEAMIWHKRLYPNQTKIQKKLNSKYLKASADGTEENKKVVVLPLGNSNGCCPSDVCSRPLYDTIDTATTSTTSNDGYWRTISKGKHKVIDGGQKVVRIWKNVHELGHYLQELRQQIPKILPALDEALIELERLTHLEEEDDSDSDSDDCEQDDEKTPFVPSLRLCNGQNHHEEESIRFPVHEPIWFKSKTKSKGSAEQKQTLARQNSRPIITPGTRFPLSTEKSDNKRRTSESAAAAMEMDITSTVVRAQTTPMESETNPTNNRTGFPSWTSPVNKPNKKARRAVDSTQNATTKTTKAVAVAGEGAGATTKVVSATPKPNSKTKTNKQPPSSAKKTARQTKSSSPSSVSSSTKAIRVIDSKDRISVSAWADIKPLLQQLGHVFFEKEDSNKLLVQFYCLPNGDPTRHANAVSGQDYFHSMQAYRAHLCAHGVQYFGVNDSRQPPLSEDDLELIAYWVRFCVFTQRATGGRKPEQIPDLEFRGNKGDQVRLLRRIGYKYASRALAEGYVVPGESTKRYLSESQLWEHLGKHGLSPACDFDQFASPEEQTALEIQIIRKYHGNHGDQAFRCVKEIPVDPKTTDGVDNEMEPEEQQEQPKYTPHAANKDALQECTRGPSEDGREARIMSPRKLMIEDSTPKSAPRRSPRRPMNDDSIGKQRSEGMDTKPFRPSPKRPAHLTNTASKNKNDKDENAVDSAASNANDENKNNTTVSRESNNVITQASVAPTKMAQAPALAKKSVATKETIIEEVEFEGSSNEEKMRECLFLLKQNDIVAHGELSNSMECIRNFVDTVIESKGRFGGGNRPPILYICGRPGTGKTMSTTALCKAAIDGKIESKEDWEKAPRMCHISCPSKLQNSKYQDGMNKIAALIGSKPNKLKRSPNDENNAATILILDEIDQLLGKKGTESILQQLCSWAKDENNVLSIIGISNAVSNSKTDRLKEYGMLFQQGRESNRLVFQTYKKEDLVRMSQTKIGFTVVHQKAHEFIAAKVANSSGDARQYLDLVQKAIIFCIRKLKLEERDAPHTKPIVTIRDAMMAIRETNQKCRDTIQSLTSYEKMTLCAGVHLARKLGRKTVEMGKLKDLTMQAFGMDADVSLEDFKGIIERLHDNDLLKLNEKENQSFTQTSMFSLLRYPVQFDLQLEDVDSALEDTVMKEDFYKRMVERLRGINV